MTFVVELAEYCLARISNLYPGWVALIMLQFPTLYQFQDNNPDKDDDGARNNAVAPLVAQGGFNAQLPNSAASN